MELEFGGYLCLNIFNHLRYPQSEMYPQLIKRQNWHRVSLAQVCLSNSQASLPSREHRLPEQTVSTASSEGPSKPTEQQANNRVLLKGQPRYHRVCLSVCLSTFVPTHSFKVPLFCFLRYNISCSVKYSFL